MKVAAKGGDLVEESGFWIESAEAKGIVSTESWNNEA
jgi:hypothetical protein